MKTKAHIIMLISMCSLFILCQSALAHNLWLNPDNYYPKVGSVVEIGIGWGHKYPASRIDQEVKDDRVEAISAVDPDGLIATLLKVSAGVYRLLIEKPGVYIVTARTKSGFFTMTSEGRKFGDKKSVADPIRCTNFHLEAKTLICAGGQDKNLSRSVGRPLELIPMTSLYSLKRGGKFTVKVMFEGKPLINATVKATYAGFEAEDIAPHSKADDKGGGKAVSHFPVETVTDESGQAVFEANQTGYWMILLSHKPPYGDREVCDEHMYNTAFTFEVTSQP